MDFLTYLIGFSLVFIGAAFFGYPLGKLVERRHFRTIDRGPRVVREARARLADRDALSADTQSDAWPDVVFTSEAK